MVTSPNINQYPLMVLSSHSYYRQHTSQDNNPWFRNEFRHACWISAADAQTRGIKDNDLVRVYSDTGEMVLAAYVTSRCIPGVVVVHHSAWYQPNQVKTQLMPFGVDRRGSVNFLTTSKEYPWILGAFPATHLVQVEKF
jgi:anaerobic dimethyl sulfoxide reductase subunit A